MIIAMNQEIINCTECNEATSLLRDAGRKYFKDIDMLKGIIYKKDYEIAILRKALDSKRLEKSRCLNETIKKKL